MSQLAAQVCTDCIDIEHVTGLHASIKQCVAGTVSIRCASGQCLAVLAINVCINKLSYAAAGKKACAQLLHKLMGDAASAISFQSQRLVPVSDHSPTSIPILVPIINPDDSSAEYTLTMKEAATLAYLWNVGLFPSSARTTVFDLLFKSVRLEEASMHTQATKDNLVSEILHAAKTGRWKPGYALTKTLMSSFHVKGRGAVSVTIQSLLLQLAAEASCSCLVSCVIIQFPVNKYALCNMRFMMHSHHVVHILTW